MGSQIERGGSILKSFKLNKMYIPAIGIIGFMIIVSIYILGIVQNATMPKARDGVLNLTGKDIEKHQYIGLDGEWEFYWESLLTHDNFNEDLKNKSLDPKRIQHVPQVWNQYQVNGKNLPGFGYATYRIKVKLDKPVNLSIRMDTISTSYRLFINNELLASNGQVGTHKESFKPEYKPQVVNFTPPEKEFDLIIQTANFIHARGGIWYGMFMGTPKAIEALERRIIFKDACFIGSLLMIVLHYMSFFMIYHYDRSSLYFVIINILLIIRTLIYGDILIYNLFPHIPFELLVWWVYITLIWIPIVFYRMLEYWFVSKSWSNLCKSLVIYGGILTFFTLLTPISIYTKLVYFIEIIGILIFTYGLIAAVTTYKHSKKEIIFVLVGAVILLISGLHDVLYHHNVILHAYGELSPLGMFVFMFFLSFLLAQRFSDTYMASKSLSSMLEESLQTEQALTQQLYKLHHIKDEFLANTSHELRTPLNGIINITQSIIKGTAGALNHRQNENLQVVVDSAKHLYHLIDDILDVSAIKRNEIKLSFKPIELNKAIESVLFVVENLKEDKKVIFNNNISKSVPAIIGDEARVCQIFYNLLGNALKFTEEGVIEVASQHCDKFVIISIKDTGIGIPKDKLKDIFNAFERIEGTAYKQYEGNGLGLFITKRLIELHG